jgi:hypothetical protein
MVHLEHVGEPIAPPLTFDHAMKDRQPAAYFFTVSVDVFEQEDGHRSHPRRRREKAVAVTAFRR